MKSTIFIQSSQGNMYMYDFLKKELIPIHKIVYLCYLLDQESKLETLQNDMTVNNTYNKCDIQYYYKKYLHYKELGFFSTFEKQGFPTYTEQNLIETISNLNNIVFEVTDICNLKCTYCTYGDLYNHHDVRKKQYMPFSVIQKVLSYLSSYWISDFNKSYMQTISIGFYGGEPLLNFDAIRKTVQYCETLNLHNRKFKYMMTTNATHIDKYIDFLVKRNFFLTISIDGNKQHHSYRTYYNGRSSFDKVFSNIKLIQKNYPSFFNQNVSFNSVLHDRNNVKEIHDFLYQEFGKIPEIHSLNTSGIRPNQEENFKHIYRSYRKPIDEKDYSLMNDRLASDPLIFNLGQFLLWYGNNQFFDNETLLYEPPKTPLTKTGTCFPFSRKMFITVNNKILVCERIDQKYALGVVDKNGVNLDLREIADKYNKYHESLFEQCKNCYMVNGCHQCIFQLNGLGKKTVCSGHKNEKQMSAYLKNYIDLLERNIISFETLYNKIIFS